MEYIFLTIFVVCFIAMLLDDNNDVVLIDPDTTQHSMDYSKLGVVLVKAIQELSKRVEELEKS